MEPSLPPDLSNGLLTLQSFSHSFSATLSGLHASLSEEGSLLERCRLLLCSVRSLAQGLERAHANSALDGALIVSLRSQVAESVGACEGARVREAQGREVLARERAALQGAGARIAELVGECERLRQMLAAAPRPARPQLGRSASSSSSSSSSASALARAPEGGSDATSPFEQWRQSKGLVGLGQGSSSSTNVLTLKQHQGLGHACSSSPSSSPSSTSSPSSAGGGSVPSPLGKGPLVLVEHPFWSPHLYPSTPTPSSSAASSAAPAATLTPPPPPRLSPLSLTHVSNIARNGGAVDRWGEEMQAERGRLSAMLKGIQEREAKVAALRDKRV